jgi:hypothetical protein
MERPRSLLGTENKGRVHTSETAGGRIRGVMNVGLHRS